MQGDGCSRKRKWQYGERHLSQVRGGRAGFQVGETSRLGSVSWVRNTKQNTDNGTAPSNAKRSENLRAYMNNRVSEDSQDVSRYANLRNGPPRYPLEAPGGHATLK